VTVKNYPVLLSSHGQALLKQAFEQETLAADHLVEALEVEPTRSVIHRSAAALAIVICSRPLHM
jgi:hypothetical protein